ncbi:hypothetical protein NHP200010_15630 [Helicobacter bizzozeronii]|nr:hypothetical protein NHP200010_15630 [Helicobacter bizzozeronii]
MSFNPCHAPKSSHVKICLTETLGFLDCCETYDLHGVRDPEIANHHQEEVAFYDDKT